jgi:hypothetical protein
VADSLVAAESISRRVANALQCGVRGRVLASFERTCDLATDDGQIIALVSAEIGNGPLNVVLKSSPDAVAPTELGDRPAPGTRFCADHTSIHVMSRRPGRRISLSGAIPWEARPDWSSLAKRRDSIVFGARALMPSLAEHRAKIAEMVSASAAGLSSWQAAAQGVVLAQDRGDNDALAGAIFRLCGLGPGLTPAGDDWLAGWLLGLRLMPGPWSLHVLSGLVREMAEARTTTLSRAFLECAAAGEVDITWHTLLAALAEGSGRQVEDAARRILSHGATSGAAMLSGFLAGIGVQPDRSCPRRGARCPF